MKNLKYLLAGALLTAALMFNATAQTAQSRRLVQPNYTMAGTSLQYLFGQTNVYAKGFSQTNSGTYPYTSGYTPIWTTNSAGFSDVALWANRDGTAPLGNISVDLVGNGATCTNQVTFVFAMLPVNIPEAGIPNNPTSTGGTFTFTTTMNGTNDVVLATNLNTSLLQGIHGIRLAGIYTTNLAGLSTTNTVVGVWLNGFTPD
ncbi:MAG: hypothetical protein WCS42_13835 [Verrucomicrobiota bacterium]